MFYELTAIDFLFIILVSLTAFILLITANIISMAKAVDY